MSEIDIESLKKSCEKNQLLSFILSKTNNLTGKIKNKILSMIEILNSNNIDYSKLQEFIFEGIPDDIPSLRSLIWKILLNSLTLNQSEWETSLEKGREKYKKLKEVYDQRLIIIRKHKKNEHPLSLDKNSNWNKYFIEFNLLEDIQKDIRRTRTHMSFFFMPCVSNSNNNITNEQISNAALETKKDRSQCKLNSKTFESNADVMTRILFIYGLYHPEVKYVQGMNEILAPIFYCFSNDKNEISIKNLEADSYISFENFMETIKDIFIKKLDNTEKGITTRLQKFSTLIRMLDYRISDQLNKYKIEMEFFAFRWLTLFFTQDFEIPDVLRLWDSILCEDDVFDFMNMIMLALLRNKTEGILNNEFAGIMSVLQNFDNINVDRLIRDAVIVRNDLNKLLL